MLYAIIATDKRNSLAARQAARPAHIKRLEQLQEAGHMVIAGPHPAIDSDDPGDAGFSGSLMVAEFSSLEEATAWAQADPYVGSGAYEDVIVKPFKQVFPR